MSQKPPTANTRLIGDWLDAITEFVPADPESKRYLIVAHGVPFINKEGEYDHRNWKEEPFLWPDRTDDAVAWIEYHAPTCDTYMCPYLQKTPHRERGNAAWRQFIHNDVDSADADELRAQVRKLGGFIVWSGSPGHGHVYLPLKYPVRQEQHEMLCEGLRDHLGGDDKIRDNDLLRPPGTLNHKPRLLVPGGQAVLVKAEKP